MSAELKKQAGERACDFVTDGMRLGIGTGSTAEAFVHALAERVRSGLRVIGVPTSARTKALCEELAIPLTTLDEMPDLDLTIDGADEMDSQLNLIKGGGGALLREKIVASASKDMLVIADDSKLVDSLGAFPLPIEIDRFGARSTIIAIDRLAGSQGLSGTLMMRKGADGDPFITDGGNFIVDASFGRIVGPMALAEALNAIPGVVEHGLFIGLARRAVIAGAGGISVIEPS